MASSKKELDSIKDSIKYITQDMKYGLEMFYPDRLDRGALWEFFKGLYTGIPVTIDERYRVKEFSYIPPRAHNRNYYVYEEYNKLVLQHNWINYLIFDFQMDIVTLIIPSDGVISPKSPIVPILDIIATTKDYRVEVVSTNTDIPWTEYRGKNQDRAELFYKLSDITTRRVMELAKLYLENGGTLDHVFSDKLMRSTMEELNKYKACYELVEMIQTELSAEDLQDPEQILCEIMAVLTNYEKVVGCPLNNAEFI